MQKRTAQTEIEWRKEIEIKNAEITAKEKLIIEKNTRLNALEKEVGAVKENSLQVRIQIHCFAVSFYFNFILMMKKSHKSF